MTHFLIIFLLKWNLRESALSSTDLYGFAVPCFLNFWLTFHILLESWGAVNPFLFMCFATTLLIFFSSLAFSTALLTLSGLSFKVFPFMVLKALNISTILTIVPCLLANFTYPIPMPCLVVLSLTTLTLTIDPACSKCALSSSSLISRGKFPTKAVVS